MSANMQHRMEKIESIYGAVGSNLTKEEQKISQHFDTTLNTEIPESSLS